MESNMAAVDWIIDLSSLIFKPFLESEFAIGLAKTSDLNTFVIEYSGTGVSIGLVYTYYDKV